MGNSSSKDVKAAGEGSDDELAMETGSMEDVVVHEKDHLSPSPNIDSARHTSSVMEDMVEPTHDLKDDISQPILNQDDGSMAGRDSEPKTFSHDVATWLYSLPTTRNAARKTVNPPRVTKKSSKKANETPFVGKRHSARKSRKEASKSRPLRLFINEDGMPEILDLETEHGRNMLQGHGNHCKSVSFTENSRLLRRYGTEEAKKVLQQQGHSPETEEK
ncbi:MAG: hypothetical protein Q9170_002411 [Blastenia crenularia]